MKLSSNSIMESGGIVDLAALKRQAKKKGIKIPRLESLKKSTPREQWEDKAPRLTEEQKARLSELVNEVHGRHAQEINSRNFPEVHERMEEEIADRVMKEFGLWAGLEWRGVFSSRNFRRYKQLNPGAQPFVDGILPLTNFLNSDVFQTIEMFMPRVVLLKHETQTAFVDDTEKSVREAAARRKDGRAYFTQRDQSIKFMPDAMPDQGGLPKPREEE